MSLQALTDFVHYPPHIVGMLTVGAFDQNALLDASGEKFAVVFAAPKTGNIEKIGFRFGTVTSAQDLKVSLQDINLGTGLPDETADQYRVVPAVSVTTGAWVETGIVSSDGTDGGTKRAVTKGDLVAVVIEFDSAVGNLNIRVANPSGARAINWNRNYTALKSGAGPTWAKNSASSFLNAACMSIRYDDGTYPFIPNLFPFSGITSSSYNSGSTPDEIGLRITVPFKCRVDGLSASVNAGGTFDMVLSDASGTLLAATPVLDPDAQSNAAAFNHHAYFASPVELDAGAVVHATVRPTSGTNVTINYATVNSQSVLSQFSDGSYWAARTDGGAFSYTTDRKVQISLLISALDDGIGGGLLTHPGMTGGMRG